MKIEEQLAREYAKTEDYNVSRGELAYRAFLAGYSAAQESLEQEILDYREALKFYSGKNGTGEWLDHVCDSYSGLQWAFHWPGEMQDEPGEIAINVLSKYPKPEAKKG